MLANEPGFTILKQAVGSTRKSMTDPFFEINDEFDPSKAGKPDAASALVLSLPEIPSGDAQGSQAEGQAAGTGVILTTQAAKVT